MGWSDDESEMGAKGLERMLNVTANRPPPALCTPPPSWDLVQVQSVECSSGYVSIAGVCTQCMDGTAANTYTQTCGTYGPRSMRFGAWGMVHGACCMVHVAWCMGHGAYSIGRMQPFPPQAPTPKPKLISRTHALLYVASRRCLRGRQVLSAR